MFIVHIQREREQRLFLFSRMCCRCFYCVLLWDTVRCEKKHHVVEENRTSFWHSAHIFPYITTDPLRSACWINELELVQSICFNHQHKNAAHRQRAVYIIHFLSDVISQSVEINASDFFQLYLLRPVNFLLTINIYKCNTVFFQGLTDVIVFVSTAHATIIHFFHMLAISCTLYTYFVFVVPQSTDKKTCTQTRANKTMNTRVRECVMKCYS